MVAVGVVALLGFGGIALAEDPQHEHPDEIDDDDDLEAVEGWLSDRMGDIHADCTEGISIGNFDACEDLDEEYESMLERYVSVERDTTDEDEQVAEEFNETRNQQAELAELLEEFNATYEDYREARRAGDEERARELARDLRRLADRIEELGGSLEVRFRELDGRLSADLNASADATRETTDEAVTITTTVEQETFEETTLTISADPQASFGEPATVTGQLTDSNGEPIADGLIVLSDGHTQTTTQTDADGYVTASYRPTTVPVGATTLDVQYLPDDGSEYLGSKDQAAVEVQATTSSVEITNATESTAFNGTVHVRGEVTASGDTVSGVPVTVSIGGVPLVTVRTDDAGGFEAAPLLPPDVPSGETTLQVRASEADSAVGVSRASTGIDIAETQTELSVGTTEVSDGIRIAGELSTEADTAPGERPIIVAVDGEEHTLTTDEGGRYELRVDAPTEVQNVVVRYEEPTSNLGPSQAETTIEVDEEVIGGLLATAERTVASLVVVAREAPLVVAVTAVALLANLVIWPAVWASRRSDSDVESTPEKREEKPEPATERTTSPNRGGRLLESAHERLDSSPEEAVKTGYAAVRTGFDETDTARTHWEFYDSLGGDLDSERATALRSLTESFERAAFAPEELDSEQASAALADAERCLAVGDGGATD